MNGPYLALSAQNHCAHEQFSALICYARLVAVSKTAHASLKCDCHRRTGNIPARISKLSAEALPMLAAHMSRSMLSVPACGLLTNCPL